MTKMVSRMSKESCQVLFQTFFEPQRIQNFVKLFRLENFETQKILATLLYICANKMDKKRPFIRNDLIEALNSTIFFSPLACEVKNGLFLEDKTVKFLSSRQLSTKDSLAENPIFFLSIPSLHHRTFCDFKHDPKLQNLVQLSHQILDKKGPILTQIKQLATLTHEKLGGADYVPQFFLWNIKRSNRDVNKGVMLGYLNFGDSLHRAILFKLLADCHQIPCTVHRKRPGEDRGTINEVWLYQPQRGFEGETENNIGSVESPSKQKSVVTFVEAGDIVEIIWSEDWKAHSINYAKGRTGSITISLTELVGSAVPNGFFYELPVTEGKSQVIKAFILGEHANSLNLALTRMSILGSVKHDHLVSYDRIFISDNSLCILMDKVTGSLRRIINNCGAKRNYVDLDSQFSLFYQLASVMSFMHSSPIDPKYPNVPLALNLNLKPENILVWPNLKFAITDYGLADVFGRKYFLEKLLANPANLPYLAPELKKPGAANLIESMNIFLLKKADVYSFGVTLAEVSTLKTPVHHGGSGSGNADPSGGSNSSSSTTFVPLFQDSDFQENVPQWFRKTLLACCDENPALRPSFDEMLTEVVKEIVDRNIAN